MVFFRLVRFPNLLIVALTQYLLQYVIIFPAFTQQGIEPALNHFHFFLLVLSTLSITIGGYIINDIQDYEIDLINKPEKVIINKQLPEKNALRWYHFNNILGFLISLYLAWYIDNIPLVLIFPAAVALLFLYSKSWKKKALIGNLVVALFCAFVAGIVLFAERDGFMQLEGKTFKTVQHLFMAYFVFAFFSTLYREIIKDMEDYLGDLDKGCETLPIKYGQDYTRFLSLVIGGTLLVLVIFWLYLQFILFNSWFLSLIIVLLIIMPVSLSLLWLRTAKVKKDFKRLSRLAKFIMATGLLYLIFLSTSSLI